MPRLSRVKNRDNMPHPDNSTTTPKICQAEHLKVAIRDIRQFC